LTGHSRRDVRSDGGRRLAVLALLVAVLVWSSTFVVTKVLLEEADPFAVTAGRFLIGFVVLAPFAYRQGFRMRLAVEPTFVLFGLTGVVLYFGLQNLGLVFTSAGNAALIQAGVPAAAAVLAFLFLRERISLRRLAGIALSVGGVILVSGTDPSGGGLRTLLGNVLIVGSAVSYGAYTVQGKALRSVWEYPAAVTTAACFAAGLMFLLPLAAGEAWLVGTPDLSLRGWAVLLYLGVVASALTLFLWNYALRSIEATAAAIYVNLIPVVGLIFALALGETASLLQILGGIIAVSGVLLSEAAICKGSRAATSRRVNR
jgi:drug/metabolite transporter (DMT)-like permease